YQYAGNTNLVTDRNGNQRLYTFSSHTDAGPFTAMLVQSCEARANRNVRGISEGPFTTGYMYNANLELDTVTRPLLDSTKFVFDVANTSPFARGNLLQVERRPDAARSYDGFGGGHDPTTGPAPLVDTFTYEPIFQQLRTHTPPRGNFPVTDAG